MQKNLQLVPVKTKFLIADDDEDDAGLFCEALCQIDSTMRCYKAENGRKVFQFLTEPPMTKPDIIFLDINMPIMNGWDCLKQLKNNPEFSHIPTIMYSTSSAKRDIDMAYSLGALLFVTKPEDFDELCKILQIVATTELHETLLKELRQFESVKVA